MTLSKAEVARLRKALLEMSQGLDKARYKPYIETRIRKISLMVNKAERREKK